MTETMTKTMTLTYLPYDQSFVDQLRAGGVDAYGNPPERAVSDGGGNPCRSCLGLIPAGAEMLIAAARPFPKPQPYAETGPVFFCAAACAPYAGADLPPMLRGAPRYLLKGYGHDDRILYGTGQITATEEIPTYAAALLSDPKTAYIDIRSAQNNCFQTRITDGGTGDTRV